MKILGLVLVMAVSSSAFAFECEVGPKKHKIEVAGSGNYTHKADGYVYMITYDQAEKYLSLAIEGGPKDINVTHEAYGNQRKSFLQFNNRGDSSDVVIRCN